MTAAPTAKAPLPPELPASSAPEASPAVDRLNPWASLSSASEAESAAGAAASSMELDSAGASLPAVSSILLSESDEPEVLSPLLPCSDAPVPAVPVPLPELPLPVLPVPPAAAAPDAEVPLPDARR